MQEELLRVESISKSFSGRKVVSNISFSLESGEIVGLLGPNGAGKSTIIGMLYGAIRSDSGRVIIRGKLLENDSINLKKDLGIVTQDNLLDNELSVEENIYLYGLYSGLNSKTSKIRTTELIKQFNLTPYGKSKPKTLSGGKCRTVLLATILVHDPSIIFLDEPTTGLDPDARQAFWRIILSLRSAGKSIILTTHYMDEVERLCDRILLLQSGEIIDQGSANDLIQRIVGTNVVEIGGVELTKLPQSITKCFTWATNFSDGVLGAYMSDREASFKAALRDIDSTKILQRKANLDDVFLRLTGRGLNV